MLPLLAEDVASASIAKLDASAALQLAESIPLLSLNLNNYKHPANPVLTAGPDGAWDGAGIERSAVIRLKRDDWRMWYACTGQRSLGLLRAPKRHVHQPIVVWDRRGIDSTGAQSTILEPDRHAFTLHLISDQDGSLRLIVWNPAAQEWLPFEPMPVLAGRPFSLSPLPAQAKLRLKFLPKGSHATVSAWIVPQ